MARYGFVVALIVALTVPVLAHSDTANNPLTATPNLLGPTGVIMTPTTEIGARSYGAGAHWVADTFTTIAKANYAPIDQLEIGLSWIDYDNHYSTVNSRIAFNAKYRICPEEKKTPALAVGVWDIADQVDITPYAVISKTFGSQVPVIINLGGAAGNTMLEGFFANMTIRLLPEVDAMVEWDTAEVNFGVRFRPVKGLTIDLLSVDNGTDREFGAGGSYMTTF